MGLAPAWMVASPPKPTDAEHETNIREVFSRLGGYQNRSTDIAVLLRIIDGLRAEIAGGGAAINALAQRLEGLK